MSTRRTPTRAAASTPKRERGTPSSRTSVSSSVRKKRRTTAVVPDTTEFDEETLAIYGDEVTQDMIEANESARKEVVDRHTKDDDWKAFEKKKKVFVQTLTFEQKRMKLEDLLRKAEAYTEFLAQRHKTYLSTDDAANKEHKFVQPPNMSGGPEKLRLREYQERGAAWLEGLCFNGLHGILADEMGLGKTIQIIACIAHVRHKGMAGPFLIIAPLSTLRNWKLEFDRWCPGTNVLLYHGSKAERDEMRQTQMGMTMTKNGTAHRRGKGGRVDMDFPIIVTSYDVAMRDSVHLSKFTWAYMVVDEGHRLKNKDCRLMKELKRLDANQRVLLTGTPLQNNLAELWSLLNFLMPDAFDDLQFFQAWFGWDSRDKDMTDQIKSANEGNNIIDKLHKILNPFMMRRLKRDVAKELPEKKEIIVYAGMTQDQRLMYEAIENDLTTFSSQMKTVKKLEGSTYTSLLNRVMQMRKVCNHPYLIHDSEITDESLVQSSGKLKLLDRMLKQLFAQGHKVLIFSQFTTMLDIIEDFLVLRNWHNRVCRIDGGVKMDERQTAIEAFNDPASEKSVFLLSTRAGGVGINLASADTVIIYDSDWNPHMDNQAQDRAHRIGQKKNVFVYRLVLERSVETIILERANAKRSLSRMAMAGNFAQTADAKSATAKLKREVVEQILSDDIEMRKDLTEGRSGGISDAELAMIMDRDLVMNIGLADATGKGAKTKGRKAKGGGMSPSKASKMKLRGRGYQIVEHKVESLVGSTETQFTK